MCPQRPERPRGLYLCCRDQTHSECNSNLVNILLQNQCCLPLVRILPSILGIKTKKNKWGLLCKILRNLICRAVSYKSVCCDQLLAKVCWFSFASSKVYSRLDRHKQQRSQGGARAPPPHWLVKYAKSHVFGAFEAGRFLVKNWKQPPLKENGCRSREVDVVMRCEKAFEFWILAEKSDPILVKTFFLETTCFWAEKTFEFPFLAEKSDSISVKTFFFFFLETTWFWAEKTFEIPSFPRNFVSIFGQTVWNWFKNNENSGQGRLLTLSKKPPLFQILATRLGTSSDLEGGTTPKCPPWCRGRSSNTNAL